MSQQSSTKRVREFRARLRQEQGQRPRGGYRHNSGRPRGNRTASDRLRDYRQRQRQNRVHLSQSNCLPTENVMNDFDYDTFLNLNMETISELIPSASDSVKLHDALIKVKTEVESDDIDTTCVVTEKLSDNEIYEIDLHSFNNGKVLPEFLEFIPVEKRHFEESQQPDWDEQLPSTITKMPRIEKAESVNVAIKQEPEDIEIIDMISDSDTDEDDSCNELHVSSDGNSNKEIDVEAALDKRKKKYILKKIISKLELAEINDLDMNILIAIYNKNQIFNDHGRTLLCEIIIKELLLNDTRLPLLKQDFHRLGKIIVKTFPKESITPYFKNIKYFNRLDVADDRGFLYTAYKKYQKILTTAGFPVAYEPTYKPSRRKIFVKQKHKTTTLQTDIKALGNQTTSIPQLEKDFIESRNERLRMMEKDQIKGKFSTIKYVEMYKVLETKKGYELIMTDAEFLYPNLNSYVSRFGKTAFNIVQYAKGLEKYKADEYVSNLLSHAKPDISENNLKFMAILLLPYVLPQANTSHLASSIQFIRLFRNETEETRIYANLFSEDSKFIKGLINVNIKLFGEFNHIYRMVVRVGVTDYEFNNPLHAIEVYYKMLLGMKLAYPVQAEHIFHFFGNIAFGVKRHMIDNFRVHESIKYESLLPFFELFNKN